MMFISLGGTTLLHHYNGSMLKMLSSIYPETDWQAIFGYQNVPHSFWNNAANHRKYPCL